MGNEGRDAETVPVRAGVPGSLRWHVPSLDGSRTEMPRRLAMRCPCPVRSDARLIPASRSDESRLFGRQADEPAD